MIKLNLYYKEILLLWLVLIELDLDYTPNFLTKFKFMKIFHCLKWLQDHKEDHFLSILRVEQDYLRNFNFKRQTGNLLILFN